MLRRCHVDCMLTTSNALKVLLSVLLHVLVRLYFNILKFNEYYSELLNIQPITYFQHKARYINW